MEAFVRLSTGKRVLCRAAANIEQAFRWIGPFTNVILICLSTLSTRLRDRFVEANAFPDNQIARHGRQTSSVLGKYVTC